MTRLAPLFDDARDLLGELADIRKAGRVPLVLDGRAAAGGRRNAALESVASLDVPDDAEWATLTSGSSGRPRVVLRTAESWAASFSTVAGMLDAGPEDRVALPAPACSSMTLFSYAHALSGGPRPADRGEISSARAFHGTPLSLRTAIEDGAAAGVQAALVGGSHLDPDLRRQAEARGIRVTAYYGAAELSFVAVDTGAGFRPFPGVDLDVRDGVLWVRSPFVALGYAQGRETTGFSGPFRRDGEWATVGDRAELMAGGLRLLGRSDDAILSASATIVPDDVEAVLRDVPGVRDAAVFGWPRRRVGALVAAIVEPDSCVDVEELLETLKVISARQLDPAHRPRRWLVGRIPRTPAGKVSRAEIVRLAVGGEMIPHV